MYPVSSNGVNRETDEEVYFFTPAFYPLDNFSAHTVRIWGNRFLTAEHAYLWKKFSVANPGVAESIFDAESPEIAKTISMKHIQEGSPSWHEERVHVMEEVLRAKAEQHEDVRTVLIKSGTRRIIENSPVDAFWGIGPEGIGQNTLGMLWMKIREELYST